MKTLFTIIMSLAFASVGISQTTNAPGSSQSQPVRLIARTYDVEAFMAGVKHLMPPKAGESDYELALRFFEQHQIEIKWSGAVFKNHRLHQLYVLSTKDGQDKVEALIAKVQNDK